MKTDPLIDSFGRKIDYLRISVTDRCNFRCLYCMPREGLPLLPRGDILSFDEIARVARKFLEMGGTKLKITGGEPLVRKGIENLVFQLSGLPGLKDLCLTTNGFHLGDLALPLFQAGLKRVNVSLDSMNPDRFAALTRSSGWRRVWEGIRKVLEVGFKLKVNVVAMKGITDEELSEFGNLATTYPIDIRFIEFMPLCGTGWHPEWRISLKGIEDYFRERYSLVPMPQRTATAKTYQLAGGEGRIGFIASMTQPFCDRCSRLRLTADGKLRNCLFSHEAVDLRNRLRSGLSVEESDKAIGMLIRQAVWKKPEGHKISPHIDSALELPHIRAIGG